MAGTNVFLLEKRGITADTALRLARYEREREILGDVAPRAALRLAAA